MNAGLGNLDSLKRHLLAPALAAQTKYDAVITDIGLWMAGMFEDHCNRKFARAVGTQQEFPCDRASFVVSRYPIEDGSVSAMDTKNKESDSWTPQDIGLINSISYSAGIIFLADNKDVGAYWSKVRFTFSGGYWWNTVDGKESDPDVIPAGAIALPESLRGAWLTQCREVWNKIDKQGLGTVEKPDVRTAVGDLELIPIVKEALSRFVQLDII